MFVGLIPGTYTISETQPGFFVDGRDVHQGVESPVNDRFIGVSLEPSEAETGYNFGESGIRGDFIAAFLSRRALFASAAGGGWSRSVAQPTPIRPWRGAPVRMPTATSISSGASRRRSAASTAAFSPRLLVAAS